MTGRVLAVGLLFAVLVAAGCLTPEPSLEQRAYAPVDAAVERVVVVPFYLHRTYDDSNRMGSVAPDSASERVTLHVSQALEERGVDVPTAAEVVAVTERFERSSPAVDAAILAEIAGRELSATGVIVGEILRYRQPRGASTSNRKPASVAYQLTLYEAPSGFKLRTIRFDETQVVSDSDRALETEHGGVENATQYKSAEDLSRWGADAIARALVSDF